jgi:peptide/nickel transport system permease protein
MLPRRRAGWIIGRGIVILLISGLAGATLVRLAPGFGVDEEALDPRLSRQSLSALESRHAGERNPITFYAKYLGGLLWGDAGRSVVFGQPVGSLLRERATTTIDSVLLGLAIGWSVASFLAVAAVLSRRAAAMMLGMTISGSLVSIPAAVLAMLCLLLRLSPGVAIGAVVLPRIFPHLYEQIRAALTMPHVVMARARGIPRGRLLVFHILPACFMPLVALGGVSVTLALGASIPIEALADSPGLGQLAWKAALGRDLPVLVSLTLLLTAVTVVAGVLADLAGLYVGNRRAA